MGKPTVFNGFKIYQVSEPFKYIHRIILQEDCEFVKSLRTDNKKGGLICIVVKKMYWRC